MNELKPCPFCGEKIDLQILNTGNLVGWECHYACEKQTESISQLNHEWFVNCPDCGTSGPMFYISGLRGRRTDDECKESAIAAWNRRSTNE